MSKEKNPPSITGLVPSITAKSHHLTGETKTKTIANGKVSVAHFLLNGEQLPPVTDTLPFAEQVRRALIRNRVDNTHSVVITGKTVYGVPLAGHTHAHYLPRDDDGDGRIDHITIYASAGFDAGDVVALSQTSSIFRRGNQPEIRMVLLGMGQPDRFMDVPLLTTAQQWHSVTPFSLPRFASRGGGKSARPRDLPVAQLQRELQLRNLPEPTSITPLQGYSLKAEDVIPWSEFVTCRLNGTQGHGLVGFALEFPTPISGPLTLGFGCHFGLGLFIPLPAKEREKC